MTCAVRGCKRRASMARWCRSHAISRADDAFSLFVRARDKFCQECGRPGLPDAQGRPVLGLQCAHVLSRRYRATRWDPTNAMALCTEHHVYYTYRPLEWDLFCSLKLGEDTWHSLRTQALDGDHAVWESWLETFAA